MKNYYYFLGISKEATEREIKQSFRKLSLKYHPDKNPNDGFFAKRFQEVQEAYETLIDPEKKAFYDKQIQQSRTHTKSTLAPVIRTFSSTKILAKKGEEITLKWNTLHADVVKVLPFGLMKNFGEHSFRITEFKEGKFQIILHATNSYTRQTSVKGITITEVLETQKVKFIRGEQEIFTGSVPKSSKNKQTPVTIYHYLAIIIIVIIILLLLTY